MNLRRLTWTALFTATLLLAGGAEAQGGRVESAIAAAPDPAGAHQRTLDAAEVARTNFSTLNLEVLAGPSSRFGPAVDAYDHARNALLQRVWMEAEADPEVVGLVARYDDVYADFRRLAAAPDTEAVALAEVESARDAAGRALHATRKARTEAILRDLEAAGFSFPSGDDFVKSLNNSSYVHFVAPVVPVFGVEDPRWPDAPWQVELQWVAVDAQGKPYPATELHACGGALIRPDWVLTAAHCVWDRKANAVLTNLRVRAGSGDLAGPMQTFQIREVKMPPAALAYVPSTATAPARNDLALLKIAPAAGLADPTRLRIVRLAPPDPPFLRDGLTVSGWGATVHQTLQEQNQRAALHGRLQMSPALRIAHLDPLPASDCARKIRDRIFGSTSSQPVAPLTEGMMCAGSQWAGTCQGDSGGPLVGHGDPRPVPAPVPASGSGRPMAPDDGTTLIGLVSWGVGCQDFTVFTKVWPYRTWIESVVGPDGRRAAR